jgi:hypothetical protein
MVPKYRAIGCVCGVFLLNIRVVLHMLRLVGVLMLEIVHGRHPSPTSSINTAMLPLLVILIEHAVEVLCRRMRIR